MKKYLLDYVVPKEWKPTPLDTIKSVVAGREGTRLGQHKKPLRARAIKRRDRRENARREVLDWISTQGYDHHFTYEEVTILGKRAHAVYLNLVDPDAAFYLRIRYNASPLAPGEVAHGEHGTWNVSLAE